MSVLLRIAAALLLAIPLLLVLVMIFALAGRRRASLPGGSGTSLSVQRGTSPGVPAIRANQAHAGLSHW